MKFISAMQNDRQTWTYPVSSFPHGLMFHHFHDATHPEAQGSIDGDTFKAMLLSVAPGRLLSAQEWLERATTGTLAPDHLCVTFDDGLRGQFDVALPVLQELGLTAFWFVYSSVFDGHPERLEIYRYLRTVAYPDVDHFYQAFLETLTQSSFGSKVRDALAAFEPSEYLAEFPFYTDNDRIFRFLRDVVLGQPAYYDIMDDMVAAAALNPDDLTDLLWMTNDHLRQLHEEGHLIGLHSYSHPTDLSALSVDEQRREYTRNKQQLENVLGTTIEVMSHPCNSYNDDTLQLLRDMGIRLGFRSNLALPTASPLEMPRQDHANILRMMSNASNLG